MATIQPATSKVDALPPAYEKEDGKKGGGKGKGIDERIVLEADKEKATAIRRLLATRKIANSISPMSDAEREYQREQNVAFLKQQAAFSAKGPLEQRIRRRKATQQLKNKDYHTDARMQQLFEANVRSVMDAYRLGFIFLDRLAPDDAESARIQLDEFMGAVKKGDEDSLPQRAANNRRGVRRSSQRRWVALAEDPTQGCRELMRRLEAKIAKRGLDPAPIPLSGRIGKALSATGRGLANRTKAAGRGLGQGALYTAYGVGMLGAGLYYGARWTARPPARASKAVGRWLVHGGEWREACGEAVALRDALIRTLQERAAGEGKDLRATIRRYYYLRHIKKLWEIKTPILLPGASTAGRIEQEVRDFDEAIDRDLEDLEKEEKGYLESFPKLLISTASPSLFQEALKKGEQPNITVYGDFQSSFSRALKAFKADPETYLARLDRARAITATYGRREPPATCYETALACPKEGFAGVWKAHNMTCNPVNLSDPSIPTVEEVRQLQGWAKNACPILAKPLEGVVNFFTQAAVAPADEAIRKWNQKLSDGSLFSRAIAKIKVIDNRLVALSWYIKLLEKESGTTMEVCFYQSALEYRHYFSGKALMAPWRAEYANGRHRTPWVDPRIDRYFSLLTEYTMEGLLIEAERVPRDVAFVLYFMIDELLDTRPNLSMSVDDALEAERPEWLALTRKEITRREQAIAQQFALLDERMSTLKQDALNRYQHPILKDLLRYQFHAIDRMAENHPAKAYRRLVWLMTHLEGEADRAFHQFVKLTSETDSVLENYQEWQKILTGETNLAKAHWDQELPKWPDVQLPPIEGYAKKLADVIAPIGDRVQPESNQWLDKRFRDEARRLAGIGLSSGSPVRNQIRDDYFLTDWTNGTGGLRRRASPEQQEIDAFNAFDQMVVSHQAPVASGASPSPQAPSQKTGTRIQSDDAFQHFKSLYQNWPGHMKTLLDLEELEAALQKQGKLEVNCVSCDDPFTLKVYRAPIPKSGRLPFLSGVRIRDEKLLKTMQETLKIDDSGFFFWPKEPLMRLPCGHDLCRPCIKTLFRINVTEPMQRLASRELDGSPEYKGNFACPLCRNNIPHGILSQKKYTQYFPFVNSLSSMRVNKGAARQAADAYWAYLPHLLRAIGFKKIVHHGHFTFYLSEAASQKLTRKEAAHLRAQAERTIASLRPFRDNPIALMEAGRRAVMAHLTSYLTIVGTHQIAAFRDSVLKRRNDSVLSAAAFAILDQEVEEFSGKLAALYGEVFGELIDAKESEVAKILLQLKDNARSLRRREERLALDRFDELEGEDANIERVSEELTKVVVERSKATLEFLLKSKQFREQGLRNAWRGFEQDLKAQVQALLLKEANESLRIDHITADSLREALIKTVFWTVLRSHFGVNNPIYRLPRAAWIIENSRSLLKANVADKKERRAIGREISELEEDTKCKYGGFRPGRALAELEALFRALQVEQTDLHIPPLHCREWGDLEVPWVALEGKGRIALAAVRATLLRFKARLVGDGEEKCVLEKERLSRDIATLKEVDERVGRLVAQFPALREHLRTIRDRGDDRRLIFEEQLLNRFEKLSKAESPREALQVIKKGERTADEISVYPKEKPAEAKLEELFAGKKQSSIWLYQLIEVLRSEPLNEDQIERVAVVLQKLHATEQEYEVDEALIDAAVRAFLAQSKGTLMAYGPKLLPLLKVPRAGFRNLGNSCYLNVVLVALGQPEIIQHLVAQRNGLARAVLFALLARTFDLYKEEAITEVHKALGRFFANDKTLDPSAQQDPPEILIRIAEKLGLSERGSPLHFTAQNRIKYASGTEKRQQSRLILMANDLQVNVAKSVESSLLQEAKGRDGAAYDLIAETSDLLLVHLVRWRRKIVSGSVEIEKDETPIEVSKKLNLKELHGIVTRRYQGGDYEVAAVIEHSGARPDMGHYVAQEDGYLVDDNAAPKKLSLDLEPYLVLYRRKR